MVSHSEVLIPGRSRFEISTSVFHNKCFVRGLYQELFMVAYIDVYNLRSRRL